jgi:hypothetical protein
VSTPPVLFLVFNRPDTTARVMNAIRAARPPRLYIAADGPRADRPTEEQLCQEVRQIATKVDWPCKVETLFNKTNLGCGTAVSSAIDWFFELEDEGIILEDDCVPSMDFFAFCKDLLDRYRDDQRVMAICGSCYADAEPDFGVSYYFSYYADIWGWATWRRAWRLYDRDLSRWPAFSARGGLKTLADAKPWREEYWAEKFEATRAGHIDTWDYQWIFTVIEHNGFACYPVRNLVSNIGYRPDATHTTIPEDSNDLPPAANRAHQKLQFPLAHPRKLSRSPLTDRQIELVRLGLITPPILLRVKRWIGRLRKLSSAKATSCEQR